jgi:hypothetical protein
MIDIGIPDIDECKGKGTELDGTVVVPMSVPTLELHNLYEYGRISVLPLAG